MTVNVTNLTKAKVSDEVGMDKSSVTFEVDEDYVAFRLDIDGISYDTGTSIEDQKKDVATYQAITVATTAALTVREMRAFLSSGTSTVEIDDSELIKEGVNHITVYAKNLAGTWSTHQKGG